jgi:hypothetical protein
MGDSSFNTDLNTLTTAETQLILGIEQGDPTPQELDNVIKARADLYSLIGGQVQSALYNSDVQNPTLASQMETLKYINSQIGYTKNEIEEVRQQNINKLRLIEINDYYSSLYDDQAWLMKIIVVVSIHICVLCILYKILNFPDTIFFMCLCGTLTVGTILFIRRLVNIMSRDNMDYNKYDIPFTTPTDNGIVPANSSPSNPWYAENNVSSVDCSCNNS